MIAAVEYGRKPYVDARAGKDALEIVLAVYKSQKEGGPVKLPLAGFASTDMSGLSL
jgi:predicted dehydrogenase